MAKIRKSDKTLEQVKKLYELLCYQTTNGIVGSVKEKDKEALKPENNFGDLKALVDTGLKLAALENKLEPEEEENEFELMRSMMNGAGGETKGRRNSNKNKSPEIN